MVPDVIRWQRYGQPRVTVDEILGLTATAQTLRELDIKILEALLRYNFFTTSQASRFFAMSQRWMEKCFGRLYQWGVVDRGLYTTATQGGNRQYVYALSRRGFEVLTRLGHDLATEWASDWTPKSETGSQRLSVAHELGRNDVCIAIAESAKARGNPVIDWEGPREATHKFIANAATHEWLRVDPDAVLILANFQPLFIEYERSGRDAKFQKKIRALRTYLVSRQWQTRYPREPWILYAIPEGTGTQGVIGGSYGGMVTRAGMSGARNYLLLDEDAWTQGTWMAITGTGDVVELWDVVGAK